MHEFVDEDGAMHRTLEFARRGLHPSWAKDKGTRPINARLETVSSNRIIRGEVHDRMPTSVTEDAIAAWLSPDKLGADQKARLLAQPEDVSDS